MALDEWGTPSARDVLTAAEDRAAAATPGNWMVGYTAQGWTVEAVGENTEVVMAGVRESDATFAARARVVVPMLADALLSVLDLADESDKAPGSELLAKGREGAHRRGYALAMHEVRLLIDEALGLREAPR